MHVPGENTEADIFVLVYSVDNNKSYRILEETWKDIRKKRLLLKGTCVPTHLLPKKSDLNRQVDRVSLLRGLSLERWKWFEGTNQQPAEREANAEFLMYTPKSKSDVAAPVQLLHKYIFC